MCKYASRPANCCCCAAVVSILTWTDHYDYVARPNLNPQLDHSATDPNPFLTLSLSTGPQPTPQTHIASGHIRPGPFIPLQKWGIPPLFSPSHPPLKVGPLNPDRWSVNSASGVWGGGLEPQLNQPRTHLLAILSLENASGGNKTVLSVHLLGQSFT